VTNGQSVAAGHEDVKNPYKMRLAATLRGSRPGVESASLIMTSLMTSLFGFKMEIAKMARENFSIGAFYNITN